MRLATLIITLLLANAALASTGPNVDQKGFDASNRAEFAGYQSYSQNNYSDSDNYMINGIKCPVPTVVFGGNAQRSIYEHQSPENLGLSIGLQIPLGTSRCKDAANLEIRKMEWDLMDAKQDALLKQERHEMETAKLCAVMMKQGFAPPDAYCQDVKKITMSENMQAVFAK